MAVQLQQQAPPSGPPRGTNKRRPYAGVSTALILWSVPWVFVIGAEVLNWIDAMTTYDPGGTRLEGTTMVLFLLAGVWLVGAVLIALVGTLVAGIMDLVRGE